MILETLTISETANRLRVSPEAVRMAILRKDCGLMAIKVGGRYLVLAHTLLDWTPRNYPARKKAG